MYPLAHPSENDIESAPAGRAGSARARKMAEGSNPTRSPQAATLSQTDLIATQQMSNVGLLAAGLAHDLNNLLTVILGSSELARDMLPPPSPARAHLHTIEATVRRAGEMCRALLSCASTDEHEMQATDANALVRDTVSLLQGSRLAFHRVRLDLAADLPPLQANPAQFRQVVMNLVANAAEACGPRGGRIRISTTSARVEARAARQLRPAGVAAGAFIRLRVTDDGCGMDDETQRRLFTPFFTRKAQGRGLGLASLLEIARTHGGGVRVFTQSERGSIFDVFFPVAVDAAATDSTPAAAPPDTTSAAAGRLRGTVLLADDEEVLRQSLGSFLTTQGLAVHCVASGEAVLSHIAAHPDTDLILVDLFMPNLSGLDAITALRAAGHRTPAILMTGQADFAMGGQLDGMEPAVVLAKPFSLVELLRTIGELLPQKS